LARISPPMMRSPQIACRPLVLIAKDSKLLQCLQSTSVGARTSFGATYLWSTLKGEAMELAKVQTPLATNDPKTPALI
jgi:hypothetical protein